MPAAAQALYGYSPAADVLTTHSRVAASVTASELLFTSAALRAMETRYVRTAAGVARYGLPIGSPIGGGGARVAKKAAKAAASVPPPMPRTATGGAAVQDALDVVH